jgi:hypothetical protein
VDVVRDATEAFLSGDLERARELTDPKIVCVRPPPFPDPQTYHGFDGVTVSGASGSSTRSLAARSRGWRPS